MGNQSSSIYDDRNDAPPEEEEVTQPKYTCKCGYTASRPEYLVHHIEDTNVHRRCQAQKQMDISGWSADMFDTVPYVKNAQKGVVSRARANGMFCVVTLVDDWSHDQVKNAIALVPKDAEKINTKYNGDLVSVIGVHNDVWRRFDSFPPSYLQAFVEKRAKDTGEVLLPATGGHLILFVKATRVDLCYELTKQLCSNLGKSLREADRTNTFAYLPTTEYAPNIGRDLSGFLDGTRNPDHLLRALVDEVLIFPRDDQQRHVGGCYMYAGKFIHNLEKFRDLSNTEKSQIIGRDHGTEQQHQGYDQRPENPRLDASEYRSKHVRDSFPAPNRFHTNRGHAAIYRQSMPYVQGNHEGLFFVAYARFVDEFERALSRMCGHFQPDGSTDALFDITRAISSEYYYVPSLLELEVLPESPKIDNPPLQQQVKEEFEGPKFKIICEYCTNCGYKTIFLEKKKVLESIIPNLEIIVNPKMPRLASFELYMEDGTVIWSKLAHPNGMNNYPECWPTNQFLIKRMREIVGNDALTSQYDQPGQTEWGTSHWQE